MDIHGYEDSEISMDIHGYLPKNGMDMDAIFHLHGKPDFHPWEILYTCEALLPDDWVHKHIEDPEFSGGASSPGLMGLNWAATIFGGAERLLKVIEAKYFGHIMNNFESAVH